MYWYQDPSDSFTTSCMEKGQEGQVVPAMPLYKRHKGTGPQCAPCFFPRNTNHSPLAFKECSLQKELSSGNSRLMTDCGCLNGEAVPWSSFNPVISWVSAERHLIKAC